MNRDLFFFMRQYLAVVIMALVPVVFAAFVTSMAVHEQPTQQAALHAAWHLT